MNKIYKNPDRIIGEVLTVLLIVFSLGASAQTVSFVRTVSTLTGSTQGFIDGALADAKFNKPYATAIDASGNIYVADLSNHRIRKITPLGAVSTFAGNGTADTTNGTGTAARFNQPAGVAVDASGNVYVADQLNHRIRKITSAGVVSTFAGSTAGFADGTRTAAKFNNPISVAVDLSGNVYVGDYNNHRIRKISPLGVVSTLAGSGVGGFANGTGTAAQFYYPYGVAVDASGNVYVGDLLNHRIRKITSGGVVTTLAGTGVSGYLDGPGTSAQFNQPYGVAVDTVSGNVYAVDYYNQCIRKISPAGEVSTIAGLGNGVVGSNNGYGPDARFNNPNGITSDASTGNLYVGDVYNYRIRKISSVTLNPFTSTFGSVSAEQSFPVNGLGLTANLLVTAPAGYEISTTSGSGFAGTLSLSPVAGKVSTTIVYIRLSASAQGGPANGTISLTSPGAATETLAVSGNVSKVDQTIAFNALPSKTIGQADFNLNATSSSGLTVTYTSSNTAVATVSGNTVTIVGLGSTNITASQAGNGNYNAAADVVQTLVVEKGSQTITFASLPPKAVGDPDFTLSATSTSGLTISYTSSDPSVATVTGNTVTIVGAGTTSITASQSGNADYNAAANVVQVLTVKVNQTITFNSLTPITYTGGTYDPGATASSGLIVTYTSDNTAVATVSGTTVTIVGAGTVHLTANQAGDATYLAASPVTQQLVVNKADQSISNFNSLPVKTYGDAAFNLSEASASSGLQVSYTSDNSSVATISNGNLVTIIGAGTATITVSQNGNSNYNAAPPLTQVLTVNKANQTIAFNPFMQATYGDGPITLPATASSSLPITYTSSNTSVATIVNNLITIVGAGTADITATSTGNVNYNDAIPVMHTLTVDKAYPVITFNLPAKTMVDPAFDLDPLVSSNAPGSMSFSIDNPSVATIDGNNVVTLVSAGTANITVTQAASANYYSATETRQLVLSKASQTIVLNLVPKTVIDGPFNLPLTTGSGLTVSYTSSNTSVATVSGNTVTIVGEGTTTITAFQAGNGIYDPVSLSDQLVVSKVSQTISFVVIPSNAVVGNTIDLNTLASCTSGLPISYFSSNTAVATIANNILTIVGQGTSNITASQGGNSVYSPAISVTQILTVSASGISSRLTVMESKIYPNPSSDLLTIEPKQALSGDLTLSISDMQGKIVFSSKVKGGEETYGLDISALGSGVYVLELSNEKEYIKERIIKK